MTMTMGIDVVARYAAIVDADVAATITSGASRTRSMASSGRRLC